MASAHAAKTLHVLVVDDEPAARSNLTALLERDTDVASLTECSSGFEAIEAIRASKPHVVFLDVQMPECDGFDVLESLGKDLPPAIIFVTAYDAYALRAFEAGALDYLLKPFDDARFNRALQRAKERLAHYSPQQRRGAQQLVVKNQGQVLFLRIEEIDWIEAADYYACLHVGSATHIIRRSLSDLETDLGTEEFTRVHRSIIVRRSKIRALELNTQGEYELVLDTSVRLPVSRRYRKGLLAYLLPRGSLGKTDAAK
jgi:two-component system, LytTR family, response regulator